MFKRVCTRCGKEWNCKGCKNYTVFGSVKPSCRCFECFFKFISENPKKVNKILKKFSVYVGMVNRCFPPHFDEIYSPKEKVVFT